MIYLYFLIYFNVIFGVEKYEATSSFDLKFDKDLGVVKIYLPEGIINIYNNSEGVRISGKIVLYHREKEKAEFFLKKVKVEAERETNSLKVFDYYSRDREGREAKKLSKLFILNLYVPKDLPLGIYLNKGEISFKEVQERGIVIEGRDLRISGIFSKRYKRIEAYNHFGKLEFDAKNFIKRYLFPFGKKVIYLNPEGEKEGDFRIFKGYMNLKIEE